MQGFTGEIDEAIAIDIAFDEAWKRGLGSRFVEIRVKITTVGGAKNFLVTFVPYERRRERRATCGVFMSLDGKVLRVIEGG